MAHTRARGRFLALGGGRDYTSKPLREVPSLGVHEADRLREVDLVGSATSIRDEPEAASDAWVSSVADITKRIAEQQRIKNIGDARERRPEMRPDHRLEDARQRAKQAKRRDLKGEFLALTGQLEQARLRDRQPPASWFERLERVETKLDRLPVAA